MNSPGDVLKWNNQQQLNKQTTTRIHATDVLIMLLFMLTYCLLLVLRCLPSNALHETQQQFSNVEWGHGPGLPSLIRSTHGCHTNLRYWALPLLEVPRPTRALKSYVIRLPLPIRRTIGCLTNLRFSGKRLGSKPNSVWAASHRELFAVHGGG